MFTHSAASVLILRLIPILTWDGYIQTSLPSTYATSLHTFSRVGFRWKVSNVFLSMAISGTQIGGIYHIYGLCKGYVGGYSSKIWPYLVQYLLFRILEFPFTWYRFNSYGIHHSNWPSAPLPPRAMFGGGCVGSSMANHLSPRWVTMVLVLIWGGPRHIHDVETLRQSSIGNDSCEIM